MLYSWIYVFLNAFSALLRQIIGDRLTPSLTLLLACCVAVFYFHMINFYKIKLIYQHCWMHKNKWLSLSFSVAIMWLCAIYGPVYIGASLHTFLFFSIMGAMGTAALYLQGGRQQLSYLVSFIGLSSLVLLVISMSISSHHFSETQLLGTFLACMSGVVGFIYGKQSSAFMKLTQLSASQILAVRFYLTMLFSLAFMPAHPAAQCNASNLFLTFLVGVFCLIIPLYFNQKGIEKSGPELNSIIISSTPFAATILEQIYFNDVNWSLFVICIFYSGFASLPYLVKRMAYL